MSNISRKSYEEAKRIVSLFEAQQRREPQKEARFLVGDRVYTSKGCRFNGSFSGTVVAVGKKHGLFQAVLVEKDENNKVVLCLIKNLTKIV